MVRAKEAVVVHEAASKALFNAEVRKLTEQLLRLRGWTVHSADYPTIDVSFESAGRDPFRVRLLCDDWNDLPPSIQFLSPEGELLSIIKRDPAGIFNESAHPTTGRPFVCTPGSREYHTHPSHISDYWSNYKQQSGFDLGGILTKLWRAWKKTS